MTPTVSPDMNATHEARASTLLDPLAAWAALPTAVRDKIGAAAITQALGLIGSCQGLTPEQGWAAAEREGMAQLEDLLRDHLPQAFPEGLPLRPDLAPLGIDACRVCGCTDACACPEGCSWVEPGLCSLCADANGRVDEQRASRSDEEALSDLRGVGAGKPLGYLPRQRIEACQGVSTEELVAEAQARGLAWRQFEEEQCHIGSGALYIWDRQALAALLSANITILAASGWSKDPDIFVEAVATIPVPEPANPALYELIGTAFADARFVTPRAVLRPGCGGSA